MNLSSYVSSKRWLILIYLYNRLLAISQCRANIMQCFCIFTNQLNCLGYDNVLPAHTTLTTLVTKVVFKGNKLSNGPGFYDKSIKCLQIPLYNPKLKLLLGFNFKIIITRYAQAITTSSADIRPSNSSG